MSSIPGSRDGTSVTGVEDTDEVWISDSVLVSRALSPSSSSDWDSDAVSVDSALVMAVIVTEVPAVVAVTSAVEMGELLSCRRTGTITPAVTRLNKRTRQMKVLANNHLRSMVAVGRTPSWIKTGAEYSPLVKE